MEKHKYSEKSLKVLQDSVIHTHWLSTIISLCVEKLSTVLDAAVQQQQKPVPRNENRKHQTADITSSLLIILSLSSGLTVSASLSGDELARR